MQPERDPVCCRKLTHTLGTLVVEGGDGVIRGVQLDVDKAHIVFRGPLDAVFKLQATSEIDADAIMQLHTAFTSNGRSTHHRATRLERSTAPGRVKASQLRMRAACDRIRRRSTSAVLRPALYSQSDIPWRLPCRL